MQLSDTSARNPAARGIGWYLDRYLGRGSYAWLSRVIGSNQDWTQRIYAKLLKELVGSNTCWLDAGCGHQISPGWTVADEKSIVQKAQRVVGCDVDCPSLRKHRSIRNIVVSHLEQLPFADHAFDLITLNMVAEHLETPQRTFTELARVLAAGGRLVIHTPNTAGYYLALMRLVKLLVPKRMVLWLTRMLEYREPDDVFPTYYRANTRQQLRDLALAAGLAEERVLFVTDMPLFYFFAPFCLPEMLFTRILIRLGFEQFTASAILGVYRRTENGGMAQPGWGGRQ
jgi:ubiquinone/menaquinone biosynthesis C-methylase UbiE